MNLFLVCFISGAAFLLGFLLFFHPLQQNIIANRWLSLFVFIIGCSFIGSYLILTEKTISNSVLYKCLISLQFLLAPSLYISMLYFVNPTKVFNKIDWLHILPFICYAIVENIFFFGKESISTIPFLKINNETSLLIRDVLPFIALFYFSQTYFKLRKHKNNLKLITSDINQISLQWLIQFLYILSINIIIWFNDALFGLPYLTEATNFVYAASIFFLGYFSIKQKAIFAFKDKDIKEISYLLDYEVVKTDLQTLPKEFESTTELAAIEAFNVEPIAIIEKPKQKRLSVAQVASLSVKLAYLMENEKLFLDNDLNLPTVAEKLDISIHEASFLINETTHDNFYNFINKYRVKEAKKLLASAKVEELNILGIAFSSGFNSKTTFNTTFKKIVGVSPSQYSKEQKK